MPRHKGLMSNEKGLVTQTPCKTTTQVVSYLFNGCRWPVMKYLSNRVFRMLLKSGSQAQACIPVFTPRYASINQTQFTPGQCAGFVEDYGIYGIHGFKRVASGGQEAQPPQLDCG